MNQKIITDCPKVSILIPTYNQEQYIQKSVESALNQTYKNIEIIVSDDNSTDSTGELIANIQSKEENLFYYCNEQNIGRVANYQKGLYKYATGDYVLNLDGDDYLTDKTYIADAILQLKQTNDAVLIFANKTVYFEADQTYTTDTHNHKLPKIIDGNWLFLNYYKNYSIPHMTSLYDRHHAISIGYYTENIKSSDWESVLRLIQNKKVIYLNRTVGVWRKHMSNASRGVAISDLVDNAAYIENPYQFALKNNIAPKGELNIWREKLLKRWYINALVKTLFLNPNEIKTLLAIIKQKHKPVYHSIKRDLRWQGIKCLRTQTWLLSFLFKHILKQESFIKDLSIHK